MRSIAGALILAAACVAPAFAQPKEPGADCGNSGNTIQIGQCVEQALKAADADLNRVYKKAMQNIDAAAKGPSAEIHDRWKSALRDSQRAWIVFRDADCDRLTQYEWWGGTGQSNAIVFCRLDKTNARVRDLKGRYDH